MKCFTIGTALFVLTTTGFSQVGIGTVLPQSKLDIISYGDTSILLGTTSNTLTYKSTAAFINKGRGMGLFVRNENPNNEHNALRVDHAGSGPGIYVTTALGIAIRAESNSIGSPALLGDNADGEAIVGRSMSSGGIAAITGRNDSTGTGVRGFNTKGGIGVVGHSMHSATGKAASFASYNAANSNDVVEILSAGTGTVLNIHAPNTSGSLPVVKITSSGGITRPQISLQQFLSNEFTRLRLSNSNIINNYWDIASFANSSSASSVMNFYYRISDVSGINAMVLRGNGNLTIAGTLTENSDARLKTNVTPLTNSLEKITSLKGYNYKWKDIARDSSLQTGLIAQEIQKQMPELVYADQDGLMSVNYIGIIPHLIESIKTQQQQIEDLKRKVEELSKKQSK